jgi:hypothetical protein
MPQPSAISTVTVPLRKSAARRRSQDMNAHTGLTSLAGASLQRPSAFT